MEFIICGNININHFRCHKKTTVTLSAMYNLNSTVNFPMSIINGSSTATDNIFIDLSRNFIISLAINWLSDHDTQLLISEDVIAPIQQFTCCYVRNINSFTIYEFQSILSMESWEDIFEGSDTNVIFNNFLNLYLKIFYACFTKSKINSAHGYNPWTTKGIKVSCHNKRILYMSCRGSNDINLKL